MPRLRVTSALSLLALLVGILGTQWLCSFTGDGVGPFPAHPTVRIALHPHTPGHRRSHAAPRVRGTLRGTPVEAAPRSPPADLVPLSTPADPVPYARLRGHLDGYVVLQISTDGAGRVADAGILRSSGDPVLDQHALATVQRWRFAVAGDGQGVHGQLSMRFHSHPAGTP